MRRNALHGLGLGLLLLVTLGAPPFASAQTPTVRISQMQIDIWPEYDEPSVLVIYDGMIDSSVPLPAPFAFIIPAGAQIHMAGGIDAQGSHRHALFTSDPLPGGLMKVSYKLETRRFYMEFYYNPLSGADERSFRYPIVSPLPVDSLAVLVQHPLRAEQFRTSPPALDLVTDANGFTYNRLRFDRMIGPGHDTTVAVSYVKSDASPSVAQNGGAGSGSGGTGSMRGILLVAGVLVAGAVGVGAAANSRRKRAAPARAVNGRATGGGGRSSREAKFCTECGAGLRRSDKFCPECGTPARRKT